MVEAVTLKPMDELEREYERQVREKLDRTSLFDLLLEDSM